NVSATLTIEGSAVVKSTNTASATITVNGAIQCQTAPYRGATFTSKDDDSVGIAIQGSTGSPTNYYGNPLSIQSQTNALHDLRFAYAEQALRLGSGLTVSLTNVQFVKCHYGVAATYEASFTLNLRNALFSQVPTPFDLSLLGDAG